jgi:hypothetical protein
VVVADSFAVGTDQPHSVGQVGIVGDHRSGVSPGAKVLGRIEREAPGVADRPGAPHAHPGTVGLACVLDHRHTVLAGQFHDRLQVHGPSVQVDGNHAACPRPKRVPDAIGGDEAGVRVDVDEPRHRARHRHRLGGADEGVGGHEHLIPRPDPQRA